MGGVSCAKKDDDDTRALYGFIMASAGFKVKAVKNGLEALAELQEHRPDVIITDLVMPVVDGLQLIRIVKNRAELANIPVVAVKAYGQDLQERARSAKADKVVEKPAEYRSVCDIIASVLPQREALSGNERTPIASAGEAPDVNLPPTP